MIGSSANSTPMPKIEIAKKYMLPSATPARSLAETRPTMIVSTAPMICIPTCTTTMGSASRKVAPSSAVKERVCVVVVI